MQENEVKKFQFHKGTIRTAHHDGTVSRRGQFQFHKGTIRTLYINYEAHSF